ncbi:hypothetical protein VOLCADRAFT_106557 [Volvox carteri f. nagariensis]|uniref:Methyltransferase domain-containing protein n=1 Tax=Volvox carteri f. nagariensis TaxID=3068 RepID=D8U862_VOLCA|nr:uncharacterized protein VOLCADRAFT_106557 [Volvox carteri f. nagariensis]EFJ44085.1 hypothetical protein VOLCADRAFT_106557 [Volvox carteri f. nagariensis]|eukprot:XP_002954886.1 hypothetical protein VOLCADRAFT_106557 [Volvox carteri f. nagariensis]
MTQFQKKVLDKILRLSTITADHGAVAAAVGAEAVDTAANDSDGAAARAAAGDHEQAVGGGEAAAMGTHAVDGGTGGGRTAGVAAAATAGGDTGTGPRQGEAGVAQDEDTTNYDAFKEWVEVTTNIVQVYIVSKGNTDKPKDWDRFQLFQPFISCPPGRPLRRVGPEGDGGKWLCEPAALKEPCTVVSMGSNMDFR